MAHTLPQLNKALPSVTPSESLALTLPQQQAVSLIQKRVAQYYEVPLASLLGRSRVSSAAWARAMAMYLTVAKLPQLSLKRIGVAFGKTSHATVLHAREKIVTAMETDPSVSRDVANLSQNVINGSVQEIMSRAETVLVLPWRKRAALSDKLESLPAASPLPKALTIQAIQHKVAEDLGFTTADLTGPSRRTQLVTARSIAMHLSYHLARKSLCDIGRAFGNRDHGTVIHALNNVAAWMRDDPSIREYTQSAQASLLVSPAVSVPSSEEEELFAAPI